MKSSALVIALMASVALSGCLTDQSNAGDAADVDSVQAGDALPTVTARFDGASLVGNPTTPLGRCTPNDEACQIHHWTLPAESADGTPQKANDITIQLHETTAMQADLDLYVFDEAGNELGRSNSIDSVQGAGEEVRLGVTEPQTLLLEVHNYAGVAVEYAIDITANMIATASGAAGGPITISKQGDQFVASRTVVIEEDVTSSSGDASASTGAGFISFTGRGDGYRLEAELRGKGDTEEEARARLAEIRLDHDFSDAARLDLEVHARPGNGGWEDKEAHLHFEVPASMDWGRIHLESIAGFVAASDLRALDLHLETTAGHVDVDGVQAGSMILRTDAGAVTARMREPAVSGSWNLEATAGAIDLDVVESAAVGYDVDAHTSAGSVSFHFRDAPTTSSNCEYASCHRHATTNGYEGRAVKTVVNLDTTAGGITAGS